MHTTAKRRLFLNTWTALIFQITTIICGFILPRLILSTYGSEVNGLINSITQFLGIISFLELGVGAVIQSSLYKPLAEKDEKQISRVVVSGQRFFSKIAKILLVYIVGLIIFYPMFANQNFGFWYTATMIVVLSISMFAQYYFGIVNQLLLNSDQHGYVSYLIQIITLVLNTLACFILIKKGVGIHFVKLVTSLIYILRPLLIAYYVKKHYNIDRKITYDKEPIQQKWNGVAQHVSAVILDGTDNIVLTIFASLKDVSVYSVYNLVTSGVKQLLMSMTNGVQSLMGDLWARQQLDKLTDFFGWIEWLLHTGTILVFSVTALLIVPFVSVYTNGVSDINYMQPLFAFLIVFANAGHCLRLPYNMMILAAGHYKQTQNNYIIASLINIVISIVAVKQWGLVGVAIGTMAAMFYQTVWMAWYNSKNLIYWPFKKFIRQFLVDIFTVALLYGISNAPIFSVFFTMSRVSYFSWIILAVKELLLGIIVAAMVNGIFYKNYLKRILKKLA